MARSFSLLCSLARAWAFFPREREPFLALENLLCALLMEEASTLRGGTTEPSESVRRSVRYPHWIGQLHLWRLPLGVLHHDMDLCPQGRAHHAEFLHLGASTEGNAQAVTLVAELQAGKSLYLKSPPHRRCPLGTGGEPP